MTDQFVAEIRIFPFNFAPTGWAFCNGQILPLSQNTALFSLLGTTYGGNGKSNFALPDMQGNVPVQPGQGQGLSLRDLGEIGGSENVTLISTEMPTHSHVTQGTQGVTNLNNPGTNLVGRPFGGGVAFVAPAGAPLVQMAAQSVGTAGGSQPHNNMMPYLTLNFCIALQGIFPPRG